MYKISCLVCQVAFAKKLTNVEHWNGIVNPNTNAHTIHGVAKIIGLAKGKECYSSMGKKVTGWSMRLRQNVQCENGIMVVIFDKH